MPALVRDLDADALTPATPAPVLCRVCRQPVPVVGAWSATLCSRFCAQERHGCDERDV
jgi:hypothetical protein